MRLSRKRDEGYGHGGRTKEEKERVELNLSSFPPSFAPTSRSEVGQERTLMQQQLSPTASTILSSSSLEVTSTLTQRLVFFLSIVRRRSFAAWLEWEATRSPYVLEVVALEVMVKREGGGGGTES